MARTLAPILFGRRTELQQLADELVSERHRLVTVTGSPGVGKSALAAHTAARLSQSFDHGAVLVDLASVSDADFVPAAIAKELGVRETTDRPIAPQLQAFLRNRRMLLVLDNFEHVLSAVSMVEDILSVAEGIQILVTSRAPLRLADEHELLLRPLTLPRGSDLGAVVRSPAVELFVARTQVRNPQFAVGPQNAEAVAEICARLDGVPLAIELAAARVGLLPPDLLAEQLRRPLGVLATTDPNGTERHSTMRDAIAWSDGLLNPRDRQVFWRLAAFAHGFPIEGAQAVCADLGSPAEIRESLQVLTDHSLVHAAREDSARLAMFETMRGYGLEQLGAVGELDDVRRRHAEWVVQLVERAEPRLQGHEQTIWLQRLDDDQENIRVALGWALQTGDADLALRLAGAAWWFWYVRGRFSEGRRWLERTAALAGGPPTARLKVLSGAAGLAMLQGHVEEGQAFAEQGRELADALADPDGTGHALMNLGAAALRARDVKTAVARLEESARLFQQSGNKWGRACALVNLQGLVRRGDAGRAQALLEESVSLLREVGDKMCGASAVNALAKQALAGGDARRAAVLYRESLVYAKELGNTLGVAQGLEGLAAALVETAPFLAATLLGASEAARQIGGIAVPPHVQADRDRTGAAVTARVGDAQVSAAWAAGRQMPPDEAAAFALAGPRAQDRRTGALTTREEQVAALVAQGLTNREIAASLFITERTAENHIQHIMNKLAVNSRAQVAVWAASRGLRAVT